MHLRGDRPDLPELELDGAADRKEIQERLDEHERAFDDRRLVEERRLFYVALTRAEHALLVSGHWWGETGESPRGPSDLLAEVGELAAAGGGRCGVVEAWAEPPEEGVANPMASAVHETAWPVDPLGSRRAAVDEGAALVRAARRAPRRTEPDDRRARGRSDDPEGWAADIEVLLAERAAARHRHARVLLPPQLSVSQLVDLAADPDALARRLRRPVPRPPDPRARRGTEFHAWLERWFSATELLEFDELPGAADEDADAAADPAGAADAAELRERFTASRWANRTPVAVEVPFETEVAGTLVRGRIDAVFADDDGGATVVDWKTGRVPHDDAHAGARRAARGVPAGVVGALGHAGRARARGAALRPRRRDQEPRRPARRRRPARARRHRAGGAARPGGRSAGPVVRRPRRHRPGRGRGPGARTWTPTPADPEQQTPSSPPPRSRIEE